jgi:hypothetical protein
MPLAIKLRSPVARPGFFRGRSDSVQASTGRSSGCAAQGGLPSMVKPAMGRR